MRVENQLPLKICHESIPFFFYFMVFAHNFYNIFTVNFKWQVVIVGLKK